MYEFLISKEQARQFAYDCFDVILRDIRNAKEEGDEECSNESKEPHFKN